MFSYTMSKGWKMLKGFERYYTHFFSYLKSKVQIPFLVFIDVHRLYRFMLQIYRIYMNLRWVTLSISEPDMDPKRESLRPLSTPQTWTVCSSVNEGFGMRHWRQICSQPRNKGWGWIGDARLVPAPFGNISNLCNNNVTLEYIKRR